MSIQTFIDKAQSPLPPPIFSKVKLIPRLIPAGSNDLFEYSRWDDLAWYFGQVKTVDTQREWDDLVFRGLRAVNSQIEDAITSAVNSQIDVEPPEMWLFTAPLEPVGVSGAAQSGFLTANNITYRWVLDYDSTYQIDRFTIDVRFHIKEGS